MIPKDRADWRQQSFGDSSRLATRGMERETERLTQAKKDVETMKQQIKQILDEKNDASRTCCAAAAGHDGGWSVELRETAGAVRVGCGGSF
jgi:hypothetical protein